MKFLIRADDFGLSEAVNYGIMKAYSAGTIKNIGLMSNMEAAEHAARLIQGKEVCLGLHVNLTVGKPCAHPSQVSSLLDINGTFLSSKIHREELEREPLLLFPQYTEISKLTIKACLDNGIQPTIKRYGRMETLVYEVKEEGVVLAMNRSIQQYHLRDLKVIELKEKIISHRYLYIRKETMQKIMMKALVNHLIKQGFVMEDNN